MKILSIFFLSIAVIASIVVPVEAKSALWSKVGNWEIYGESETSSCMAIVGYTNGQTFGILFVADKAGIIINGPSLATKGQTYNLNVAVSTGAYGTLEAIATDENTVMFLDVNQVTVKSLVNSKAIAIQGLGVFDLTGSKKAMAQAWQCYEALNSF